jgi:hypothetical protein
MYQSHIALTQTSHITRIVRDLISCGWTIESIPSDGRIPSNRALVILKFQDKAARLRISAYKVTQSGRNKPHERRVEITTTFNSGLRRMRGTADVVIGVDAPSSRYVGVDPRRLQLGGDTHNASSFFDLDGLTVPTGRLLIEPRAASHATFSNGVEYHAFFDRSRLPEYLLNHSEIHAATYAYRSVRPTQQLSEGQVDVVLSGTFPSSSDFLVLVAPTLRPQLKRSYPVDLILAVEDQDISRIKRPISPEDFRRLQEICEEVGHLGEQLVLNAERSRLRKLGLPAEANKVHRRSLVSVSDGYDILSFENDGKTKRYLEVKSTVGSGYVVNMSLGEWRAAGHFGKQYYLVRVTQVRSADPKLRYVQDPVTLEKSGRVVRSPAGWLVDLR